MDNLSINDYDLENLVRITTKRFGFDLFTTPQYQWKFTDIVFEEMTALLIRQNAKGVGTFIDIGAHNGFYSVLAGLSNPDCQLLAFEPVPENAEIVKKNLLLNNLKASVNNVAVSDFAGSASFQISEATSQSGFIANPDKAVIKEIEVDVIPIDHFIDQISDGPVLVKMDTEGSESKVLRGMEKLIKKIDDLRLVIEVNPACLEANGYSPTSLLNQIDQMGFDIFVVFDMEMKYVKYVPGTEWGEYMGARTYRNIFCIKKSYSLNVCIFNHSNQLGGAEISLLELVDRLVAKHGVICTVVLPYDGLLRCKFEDRGVATHIVNYHWWCASMPTDASQVNNMMLESYENIETSLSSFEKIAPDIFITNTMVIPWGALSALMLNRPHIWWIKEFGQADHNLEFYFTFQKTIEIINESSNYIVVNSASVKKALFQDLGPEKCSVAINNVSLENPLPHDKRYYRYATSTKLVIIGNVARSKGQDDAIHAVKKLIETNHDVELCVLGGIHTSFGEGLKSLVKLEGLEDRIHFVDFVENIRPLLEQADISLMCSESEAFGRVTVESMLLGLPVIGTNMGGTVELIDDGVSGFLYSPGDINELADKIAFFINTPDNIQEFGKRAKDSISRKLTINPADTAFWQYLQMYKSSNNERSQQLLQMALNWQTYVKKKYLDIAEEKNNVIQVISTQLAEKEQVVQALSSDIFEKEQVVQQLSSQFAEKEQIVQQISSQVAEKEQVVQTLASQLNEKEQAVQALVSELNEKEQAVQVLASQIDEKEQVVQALVSQLDEKEDILQTLFSQENEQESTVDALSAQLAEKDQLLNDHIALRRQSEQAFVALHSKLNEREQVLQDLNAKLWEIYGSRAWRLVRLMWKVRLTVIPLGSRRANIVRSLYKFTIEPLRKINLARRAKKDLALINASGLFNKNWYLAENPDVLKSGIDPVFHYLVYGGFEGRDPSPDFSSSWYLNTYRDISFGINPLIHYLKHGKSEGRSPNNKSNLRVNFENFLISLPAVKDGCIFVSHNASATGAPINLLNQCAAYKEVFGNNFVTILISGGVLQKDFQSVGHTLCLERSATNIVIDDDVEFVFSKLKEIGYSNCIANTVVSGVLSRTLKKNHIETVYLVHELPQLIQNCDFTTYAKNIAKSNSVVVFAANYVADKFISNFGLSREFVRIIPQGIRSSIVFRGEKQEARKKLLSKLGIPLSDNIKIVLGAGLAQQHPKGTDLFLKVAQQLYKMGQIDDVHFIWVGGRNNFFERWKNQVVPELPYKFNIHFMDFESDPAYIFASADLFLLTSREDSFPSVALESMINNVPVITFKDTGGIEEILDGKNGIIVGHLNVEEMALAALDVLSGRTILQPTSDKLISYQEFIEKIVALPKGITEDFINQQKVTVIIPNYNYEIYLKERLQSILNQTYKPSEIIFLDDVSSDNSVDVAKNILMASDIPYKIIANEINQGVFKQWMKGIEEASNEFVWIAEADDYASEDFLATLIEAFKDKNVSIAYCRSQQVDENSEPYEHNYLEYTNNLSTTKWLSDYTESGLFEVSNYLAIKNTIPNVSGVVFRKEALFGVEKDITKYRYAGDWLAYLHSLKNGKISYFSRIMNYHRRHRQSTVTDAGGNSAFFEEVRSIYEYVTDNFPINMGVIDNMEKNLSLEKNSDIFIDTNKAFFEKLRVKNLATLESKKILTVLIILSEFKIGGGEITGLRLANYLAEKHNVYLYPAKKDVSKNFLQMIGSKVHVIDDETSLEELIRSGTIDFVNSHVWWADKLTYSILKENNIFWILSMHGCYEMLIDNPAVDPEFSQIYESMYKRANVITYDTKKNLRVLNLPNSPALLGKAHQIYHGYAGGTLSSTTLSRSMLGFSDESFIFVFVGRGIKEKGWEEAIKAAISLRNEGLDIGLLLIGDSDYVQKLKKEYDQVSHIKFVGEKSNLIDYFRISDCGLLPTYFVSESQPLTIIEFLSAGLPVITTDIGEIKNMIQMDEMRAGVALPLVDGRLPVSALRAAMKELFLNKKKYDEYKSGAKPIFDAKFDIEKFSQAYCSLFKKM